MARIVKALVLSFGAIAGISSGQTEELEIVLSTKDLNLDDNVVVAGTEVITGATIHRSSLVVTKTINAANTHATLNISACGLTILNVSTEDWNWYTKTEFVVSDITDIYTAIYGILQA